MTSNADELAGSIESLPMFPEITQAQIDRVCAAIREFHTKQEAAAGSWWR